MSNFKINKTMKTLKITTVIVGILVAILSLDAHAAEKPRLEKSAAEKKAIVESMRIDKAFEIELIEEYLEEQIEVTIEWPVNQVKIYNANDELIYEGDANSENAVLLMLSADFLMEFDQVKFFRLQD
jgi:hypothetical protein